MLLDSLWSSQRGEQGAGLRGGASLEGGRASLSLWGWGLLPICGFHNGNLHFTNERINSRETVFLATVALCFKGVGFF